MGLTFLCRLSISWNIRGLGSSVKKRFLFKLIKKKRRPDMVFVQETKLEIIDVFAVRNYGVVGMLILLALMP